MRLDDREQFLDIFAEEITLTPTLPKGTVGITAKPVKIAKGQNAAKIVIEANDKAKEGELSIAIKATGTFNKVGVNADAALKLKVQKAAQ